MSCPYRRDASPPRCAAPAPAGDKPPRYGLPAASLGSAGLQPASVAAAPAHYPRLPEQERQQGTIPRFADSERGNPYSSRETTTESRYKNARRSVAVSTKKAVFNMHHKSASVGARMGAKPVRSKVWSLHWSSA